jgi:hypothetical protein
MRDDETDESNYSTGGNTNRGEKACRQINHALGALQLNPEVLGRARRVPRSSVSIGEQESQGIVA